MNDAVLRIGAEIQEALSKLSQLAAAYSSWVTGVSAGVTQIGQKVSENEKFFDKLFLKITGAATVGDLLANGIVGAMGLISDAIQKAIGYIIELGARGSDVENTTLAFRGLTAGLGADGLGKVLPEAREKTAGLISDFDLMRAANRAMIFGIDLSKSSMGTLGEAAIKLGRAMGQDATRSLNDLVLAIGRVSPRILDNLGIIVKVTEANKAWGAAHDKTTQQMTGAERVLAFQELAMAKIEEKLKNLGPLQLTVADLWQIMTVKMVNWQDKLAVAINRSAVFHTLLTEMGKALDGAFDSTNGKMIDMIVSGVETLVIWLVKAAKYAIEFGTAARREYSQVAALGAQLTVGIMQLVEGFLQAHSAFSGLAATMNPFSKATQDADVKVKALLGTVVKMRTEQEQNALVAVQAAKGQDTFSIAAGKTSEFLGNLADKLESVKGKKKEYTVQTQLNTEVTDDDTTAQDKHGKAVKSLGDKLTEMNLKLKDLEPTQENLIMVTKEYGTSIGHLINQAKLAGIEIPESVEKWAEAVRNAKLDEAIRKNGDAMRDQNVKMFDAMAKETGDKVKEQGKSFDTLKESFAKATDEMAQKHKSGFELQLAQADAHFKEEIRKLGTVPPEYEKTYKMAVGLIKAQYQVKDSDRAASIAKEIKDLGIVPEVYDAKYAEAVQSIKDKYAEMGQAESAKMSQEIAALGPLPAAYEEAYQKAGDAIIGVWREGTKDLAQEEKNRLANANKTWSIDFKTVIDAIPNIIQDSLTGGGGWAGAGKAVIAKVGETFGGRAVTNVLTDTFNKYSNQISSVLGMTMTSTLGAMLPGIGAAIGALAGPLLDKIVGFFRGKPEHEKIMEDVGKTFGTKISEGLAKKMEADSKTLFNKNRYAAEVFNLDKIIEEAGGLNSKNYDMFISKLRDVFVMVGQGKMSADQARETLDTNFTKFADHLLQSGEMASKGFLELISLNRQFGTESESITNFVSTQSAKASAGLASLLGPIQATYGKLGEELTTAKKKVEELEVAGKKGSSEHAAAVAELNVILGKQQAGQASVGEEIERVGRLTLATFNAQVAAGIDYVTAINNAGPALDGIIALQKSLGIVNENSAVAELTRFRDLTNQNKELVTAVGGLNQTMVAMQTIGALNADTLADLETQGLSMYSKLTAAGFTETQALTQMKGWIENVIQSHRDLGIPIDENTQKLIDQAREQGILKNEGMSTNDILMGGIGALIEAVGGKLPDAFRRFRDASNEAASNARGGLGGTSDAAGQAENKLRDLANASGVVNTAIYNTPWENFAARGVNAAKLVSSGIYETGGAFSDVQRKLEGSIGDFDYWSRKAGESIEDVREGVDGVTFGDSPGGIKEWRLKLMESVREFHNWRNASVSDLGDVRRAVDNMAFGASLDSSFNAPAGSVGGAFGTTIVQHVNIDAKGSWIESQENLQRWGTKAGEALAAKYFGQTKIAATG